MTKGKNNILSLGQVLEALDRPNTKIRIKSHQVLDAFEALYKEGENYSSRTEKKDPLNEMCLGIKPVRCGKDFLGGPQAFSDDIKDLSDNAYLWEYLSRFREVTIHNSAFPKVEIDIEHRKVFEFFGQIGVSSFLRRDGSVKYFQAVPSWSWHKRQLYPNSNLNITRAKMGSFRRFNGVKFITIGGLNPFTGNKLPEDGCAGETIPFPNKEVLEADLNLYQSFYDDLRESICSLESVADLESLQKRFYQARLSSLREKELEFSHLHFSRSGKTQTALYVQLTNKSILCIRPWILGAEYIKKPYGQDELWEMPTIRCRIEDTIIGEDSLATPVYAIVYKDNNQFVSATSSKQGLKELLR